MGSNMAECHPVGFQWVVEARERGAKVIHVDPRFTRTSALADLHVPLRAGSDIAFLGGIVNYILEHGREFREYVQAYTNARTIVSDDFRDTEDLDGLFSGLNTDEGVYERETWQYKGMEEGAAAGHRDKSKAEGEQAHGAHGGELEHGEPPEEDETLQDPRCAFQLLKKPHRRCAAEMVERICGVPRETFLEVAEALCENSGRERTSAFAYAVGWTQHTVGVQYIRTAAMGQLRLDNIGRPGGGILALRGHASIQGSTDIPTLFNILPGYLPMPHAHQHRNLEDYVADAAGTGGFWGNKRAYMVSLLKSWWGDAAQPENDFCFDYLPMINGDHSSYRTISDMIAGKIAGYFLVGENPSVGHPNGRMNRFGLANLEWLVVRDLQMIESATFWQNGPEIATGEMVTEKIATEVFVLPAASHVEKEGTFTQTQRMLQWREKAVEPPGDARSDLWFYFHLGRILRERLKDSTDPRDRALLQLTWDYPAIGETADPDGEAVLREINGVGPDGKALNRYLELKDDGSTTSGCWIYSGVYADEVNQAARRKPGREQGPVPSEWGWAWPLNRRLLYNRASADPDGNPWSERKKYVYWDDEAQ